jgi:hypothetical protein
MSIIREKQKSKTRDGRRGGGGYILQNFGKRKGKKTGKQPANDGMTKQKRKGRKKKSLIDLMESC